MALRPHVLLFDLDGTLVSTGGAGRIALERACELTVGRRDVLDFDFSGRTDQAIFRQALVAAGVDATEIAAKIDELATHYVELLAGVLDPPPERYHVLPGVEALLAELAELAHVALGLGTGNLERGARLKLAPARLGARFAFGGFGSDAEERAELIGVGARRGAAALGQPDVSACRVVIIGDTPLDVAAAHGNGAECLAVATGNFDASSLRESGAERVVETLAEPGLGAWLAGT